jgi:hypothetical protein
VEVDADTDAIWEECIHGPRWKDASRGGSGKGFEFCVKFEPTIKLTQNDRDSQVVRN